MFQKTLKTTTGKITVTIPTLLSELKLGQLMTLQSADNLTDLQAIHILSGLPLQQLQQVRSFDELQAFNEQVRTLAHQIEHLYNADKRPKAVTFTLDGKPLTVKVPASLSIEPAGAFMAARDVIADEISAHIARHGEAGWQSSFNPSLKACSQVLAHYFYVPATRRPYNEHGAEAFAGHIEQLPVTQALPLARYFFLSYPNLSKPKTGCWPRLLRRWSSGQASRRSGSSGTSTR